MYDLNDVLNIIETGFSYALSPEIIKHIQKIEHDLGIVHNPVKMIESSSSRSYSKPITTTTNNYRNTNTNRKEDLSWENVRNFKTTKIDKKEGLEKKINDVRICINKMYARLYKELIHLYPVFQNVLDNFLQKYMVSLNEINYADPNVDYDLFCVYTKQSDKRKATAQFLVHMMREKILSQEYILSIIQDLIVKVRENMDTDNKINEVEEITELVNIFVSQSIGEIIPTESWSIIREFAKYKLKDKKSLSSRIIFKYTDLVALMDKSILKK